MMAPVDRNRRTRRMPPLKLHAEPVRDEWVDTYGHLNEAYYLVPFSNANWALLDHFGIGRDYYARTGGALYTVESHIRYVKELRAPALMEIESLVLGADAKRLRVAHVMRVDTIERATFECVMLHFDSKTARTAPMPEDVQAALRAAQAPDLPPWAGRGISLERK
jgi:acyl-CoA thioesterase FadM